MIALAARRMGIRTAIWTGGLEAPAVEVADEVIDLPFNDPKALDHFCAVATVATVEFENIPRSTLEAVAERLPLHPSPAAKTAKGKRISSVKTASPARGSPWFPIRTNSLPP